MYEPMVDDYTMKDNLFHHILKLQKMIDTNGIESFTTDGLKSYAELIKAYAALTQKDKS